MPQGEGQKSFCERLAQEDTGAGVSPFVRNFVWNDLSSLQFHMNERNQTAASNEAVATFAGFATAVGGGATLVSGRVGQFAASRAVGAVSLFVAVLGLSSADAATHQRAAAASIEKRIRYLNAIRAGICP